VVHVALTFIALKDRNSNWFMYFNPGRKNVQRNGEEREPLRPC
jgi:hypothetical protein